MFCGRRRWVSLDCLRILFICRATVNDLVQKIRGMSAKCQSWVREVQEAFKDNKKVDMFEAKRLLELGEKINVLTPEIKTLRGAIRSAKIWSNKVQKYLEGQEQGVGVQELLYKGNPARSLLGRWRRPKLVTARKGKPQDQIAENS